MSKNLHTISFILLVSIQILHFFNKAAGQDIDVRFTIGKDSANTVRVEGRFLNGSRTNPRNLVLLDQYAGFGNLARRAHMGWLKNGDTVVTFKQLIPGEYLAEQQFTDWACDYELTPTFAPLARAHVSWIEADRGILMLNDLLPQMPGSGSAARVRIDLPSGWRISTTEKAVGQNSYVVSDVKNAVFVISKPDSVRILPAADSTLSAAVFDNWSFSDSESLALARDIYGFYSTIFRGRPAGTVLITLMKLPASVGAGEWEADTRGTSVTILSADATFKSQGLQQLHEQLRHELFHLWIPNGISLTGNYDWFYEGFALYQSLKTGLAVNRIRFEDFLDTLSRAYNIDNAPQPRISLIEASKNRWNGANTQVYARGMLTAFLCDLVLLETSGGKISATDIIRQLYERHRPPATPIDGNTAVMNLLGSYPQLRTVVERNITGSEKVVWSEALQKAGIDAAVENSLVNLRVAARLTGRQRDLLDKLGYNNWRKLSQGVRSK